MQAVARTGVYDWGIWACRRPWKREEATDGDCTGRVFGDYDWFCLMYILIFCNLIHLMATFHWTKASMLFYWVGIICFALYGLNNRVLHLLGHFICLGQFSAWRFDFREGRMYDWISSCSISSGDTSTSGNFITEWSGTCQDNLKILLLKSTL